MYVVSNKFREQEYSGESLYKANLLIDGTLVPNSQISKIIIENHIIDTSSDIFYVGSFVSQKLTVKFRNLDGLNIETGKVINLSIIQTVDGIDISVPIGIFNIDDLLENYQETCEITALDNAVKFKQNIDYSPCFVDGKATIDTILEYICEIVGVEIGDYPDTNGDIEIGTFDNTVSGKRWISYIAELKGCNAKIDRTGSLILVPLKQESQVSINALKSEEFVLGEEYKISKVVYYDAVRNFTQGDDSYNTLFIRQDNPFIQDQTTIDNIYDVVEGLDIWNVKTRNYGDISLDAWDIVEYTLGNDSYLTYYDSIITYEMTIMSDVETKISTKQQEVTTNVVKDNVDAKIKKVQTTVDNIEGTITLLTEETLPDLQSSVTQLQTSTYTKTEIQKIISGTDENGVAVTSVQTTSNKFDENGLHIAKTDAPTESTYNEMGVDVKDTQTNSTLLYAGYVPTNSTEYTNFKGQTIVGTKNIVVEKYAVFGKHSRIEDFTDNGVQKTGMFRIE